MSNAVSAPTPVAQRSPSRALWALLLVLAPLAALGAQRLYARATEPEPPPPLPDWSGLWTPDRSDPKHVWGVGDPPWTPEAQKQVDELKRLEKEGVPRNVYIDCLPEGMPSYVIMTLNAQEFLFTEGRVTILGEFDGNRLRRIYTDGRGHPEDPELTFNGHSIGHWEGNALHVDTVAILPQTFLPIGQAVALPNNGDMHIKEVIRQIGPNKLRFELEIHAPKQLREPWKITRVFNREKNRKAEIVEASCRQGDFATGVDAQGNQVFLPIPHDQGGAPLPFER
jgi:hypothetical protein